MSMLVDNTNTAHAVCHDLLLLPAGGDDDYDNNDADAYGDFLPPTPTQHTTIVMPSAANQPTMVVVEKKEICETEGYEEEEEEDDTSSMKFIGRVVRIPSPTTTTTQPYPSSSTTKVGKVSFHEEAKANSQSTNVVSTTIFSTMTSSSSSSSPSPAFVPLKRVSVRNPNNKSRGRGSKKIRKSKKLSKKVLHVRFSTEFSVVLISEDEMEERFVAQKELWYTRNELISQRKLDCQQLVNYLKVLKMAQQPKSKPEEQHDNSTKTKNNDEKFVSSNDEEYSIRGLEIVLYKPQRDETKHRAAKIVFSEQHEGRRLHQLEKEMALISSSSSILLPSCMMGTTHESSTSNKKRRGVSDDGDDDDDDATHHGPLGLFCSRPCQKKLEREKRAEGDSSSSSSSSSSSTASSSTAPSSSTEYSEDDEDEEDMLSDQDDDECRLSSQLLLERRIADRYSMATFTCRDEAYLRGLQDAQVAREIFLG